MKKFVKLLLFCLLAFMPLLLFAQVPDPPSDIPAFVEWFKSAFTTWAGAYAVIMILTEKVKRMLDVKGFWAVVLSWGISLPIVGAAWWFNIGVVDGVTWWLALIYALSFSLSANLTYLVPIIKEAVRIIVDYFDKRKVAKVNN